MYRKKSFMNLYFLKVEILKLFLEAFEKAFIFNYFKSFNVLTILTASFHATWKLAILNIIIKILYSKNFTINPISAFM